MLRAQYLTGDPYSDFHLVAVENGVSRTRAFLSEQMSDIQTVTVPSEALGFADGALIAAMVNWMASRRIECGYSNADAERRLMEYVRHIAPSLSGQKTSPKRRLD